MKKHVVVIGSGPGGYVAAIRASQLGAKVTLIEKGDIGGVCLNEGCIPSKALIEAGHFYQKAQARNPYGVKVGDVTLNFADTQRWKDRRIVYKLTRGIEMLLQTHKVEIISGAAKFLDDDTLAVNDSQIKFDACIVATGSVPMLLRGVELSDNVVDSKGALNFSEVPHSLIVVGGGYIGSELASAYTNLGSNVTIVEAAQDILVNFDDEMVSLVKKSFKSRRTKILTNTFVKEIKENKNSIEVIVETDGQESLLMADKVLLSIGRRPNSAELGLENTSVEVDEKGFILTNDSGQTKNPKVYAIGDVIHGLALAHKASYEAKVVADNIVNNKQKSIRKENIVAIAFTDPEVASVGVELKNVTSEHVVKTFDYAANGRSLTMDSNQGFIRLISKDDVLVGAQIIGHNASELIGECALAIENKLTLKQIVETIHAHPTQNEMIMDAVEDMLGYPIHG